MIRSQEEFDRLIGSSDWLGAKSVLFVGDGTLTFKIITPCIIPDSVIVISGINSATIELCVDDLKFGYNVLPTKRNVMVSDITLVAKTDENLMRATGFVNMRNLTNCHAILSTFGHDYVDGFGFSGCYDVINCTATLDISGADYGGVDAVGFQSSEMLLNCEAHISCRFRNPDGQSPFEAGFYKCSKLINCVVGSIDPYGLHYGFHDCDTLNGCRKGKSAPTNMFNGTNTGIDDKTCDA